MASKDYLVQDVSRDGEVTALDALIVINHLNRVDVAAESAGHDDEIVPFVTIRIPEDVNGDGRVTAVDALQVINELNRQTREIPTPAFSEPLAMQQEFENPNPNDRMIAIPDAILSVSQVVARNWVDDTSGDTQTERTSHWSTAVVDIMSELNGADEPLMAVIDKPLIRGTSA